ncbi:MAG: ABC transporter permease [Candidatus Limnocylindrales bacterium]
MTEDPRPASGPDGRPPSAEASVAPGGRSGSAMSRLRESLVAGARLEVLLLVILFVLIWWGAQLSRFFLTGANFGFSIQAVMEISIMALAMTPIIITGEIDLSVESMVGLSSCVLGWLWASGVPLVVALPLVLLVGVAGGLFNGVFIGRWGLPSLVVTLATYALFRGLGHVVLGTTVISDFPAAFTEFGFGYVPGTVVPWSLLVFLVLAVVAVAIVHRTWIGRQVFAVGKNKDAARYSGVRVGTLKLALFAASGLVAAFAGIILTSRTSTASPDNGLNMTLAVVTIVVLGGVDINGGKGTVPGVILAVFILATLKSALTQAGISTDYQNVGIGLLLIVSVIAPHLVRLVRELVDRVRLGPTRPARGPAPGEAIG